MIASRGKTEGAARRGGFAASSLAVIALPLMALAIGLALEVALVGDARERLQSAADAGALAAAAELFDPNALRPGATVDPTDALNAANAQAKLYVNMNLMMGYPLTYASDRPILAVFGNVADPTIYSSPLGPWDDQKPCNTVVVTVERSKRLKNPVPLRLGPLLGVIPGTVVATARGTLDRRVYGFRPLGNVPAPLIPLAVAASGTPPSWASQALAPAVSGQNDNYTVNPRTGQISPGADGIPEVTLQVPFPGVAADPNDNVAVLDLGSPSTVAQLILNGVRVSDLVAFGGQFALGASGTIPVSGAPSADASLAAALNAVAGTNRVWPLYDATSPGSGSTPYTVIDFAAGWVVQASNVSGRLTIVVQPSQFPLACALVRAGQASSRYVAKLNLTR